jgi:3-oxoacyl-[acyl-carrier protein] reductase
MKLKGKNAFITGSAQGIGKAIAIGMAQEGANIAVADMNVEEAERTAQEIKAAGVNCIAIKIDVSRQDAVKSAFEKFGKEFDGLDILVNNAGITRDALILRMKEKQHYGKIINVSSVVAFTGNPGQANYSASKAGIVGLTKTIAKEYASRGIRANAVAPGFISTAMTDAIPDKIKEDMKRSIPLGHFGVPEDVARAVIFLSSGETDYITGQVFHINGGMYM